MIGTFLARRCRKYYKFPVFALIVIAAVYFLYIRIRTREQNSQLEIIDESDINGAEQKKNAEPLSPLPALEAYDKETWPAANYDVHVFYYAWYGTPAIDLKWYHWNHRYLPHWDNQLKNRYPRSRHEPPNDIGANYYPMLGPYSSRDPEVIERHMYMIRKARIGVVAVSWYPSGQSDDEGFPPDPLIPVLLDAADKYDLKLCVHIEPFEKRNAETMRQAIEYLIDRYGNHNALYKRKRPGSDIMLPLFYIYDSYQVEAKEWNKVFGRLSELTVRDTKYDGIFIGLVVEVGHMEQIYNSGLDGMYTYFASNTFVYGSTPSNWNKISSYCKMRDLMFIPSVGPGYIDTQVRPWNNGNTKDRRDGQYYRHIFKLALTSIPDIISITSFNEWHEGTQIEPASPHARGYGVKYLDYGTGDPNMYMDLTRQLIDTVPSSRKAIDIIER